MDRRDIDRSKVGEGRYSNYAEIGHNESEFVFDFGQVWLDGTPAGVYVRIVTSPDTAERLYKLLDDSLSQYRNAYGEIVRDETTEHT
jgi:hypothetical protein